MKIRLGLESFYYDPHEHSPSKESVFENMSVRGPFRGRGRARMPLLL